MIQHICDRCKEKVADVQFKKWLYTDSDPSGCGSKPVYSNHDYCHTCFKDVKVDESLDLVFNYNQGKLEYER